MKKIYITILSLFLGINVYSQNDVTVNQGQMKVEPGTQVSTYFDFKNESSGDVLNDGEMHFYGHYQNEGLFSYTTNSRTGYVVFEGLMPEMQKISGTSPSSFYDVLFNKSGAEHSFHLTNDIANAGTVNLLNGVVLMDKPNGGAFVFLKGSKHINTSDRSHVNGEVTKNGNEGFKYPVGDGGYYRFAGISAPVQEAEIYTGEYLLENSNSKYPHASRTGVLQAIDDKEYWIINQSVKTDNSVIVTLSWDTRTTPQSFTDNPDLLHVVRWDEKQKLWVDEGGVVNYADQTVTTPVNVDGFGIFTLGTIKKSIIREGDVVIYNGVTPDGDGMNDYFIIDNINQFPNNHVTIYNRWGRKVYETYSYDSNGNVFNGTAQGNAIVNQGEKLPTGTYYYIVEYLYDRNGENQWVKKVGHLHLENND